MVNSYWLLVLMSYAVGEFQDEGCHMSIFLSFIKQS